MDIKEAVRICGGLSTVANIVGKRPSAIHKWVERGCLPRTEWTGETEYAKALERASRGKVKARDLLLHRPQKRKQGS